MTTIKPFAQQLSGRIGACAFALALVLHPAYAHDPEHESNGGSRAAPAAPLPFLVETKGPIKRPSPVSAVDGLRTTGNGYWTFVAATNSLLPIPDAARAFLKGAHGTLIVDAERDMVYWGLEQVGWIEFSQRLAQSAIVKGDPAFQHGNLHGADLLPRRGKLPLVAVADNVDGEVYLSDTSFKNAAVLGWPKDGPYQSKDQFHPTDTAFTKKDRIYVTDGYGKAWFMPVGLEPLAYAGEFYGGKPASQTPHGITYRPDHPSLILSARPEGQIKTWSLKSKTWTEVQALPAGSTVCDVDLWDDYAIAPCLDGPKNSPGPIYVLNLKKKAIVATLRPKEDLGFTDAQHIHDAAWYVVGKGRDRELYVLFTNWNPGGIGALKLVSVRR